MVIDSEPATLMTARRDVGLGGGAAARATSPTKVKLRTCEPSPNSGKQPPVNAEVMSRCMPMSGRWRGPYTVKYRSVTVGTPKLAA